LKSLASSDLFLTCFVVIAFLAIWLPLMSDATPVTGLAPALLLSATDSATNATTSAGVGRRMRRYLM